MIVTLRTPIGDIVAKQPRAAAVFEQHEIDYCCEGEQPLQAACHRAMADPAVVLQQIVRAASEALVERDWTVASLTELTEHIVSVHHANLRQGLSALASRLEEPASGRRPGGDARDHDDLRARFESLREVVEPHLRLEEESIFPAIARADGARLVGRPRPPRMRAPFRGELGHLVSDHRLIDTTLRELSHAAARVFAGRPGVPTVFTGLSELEADVHRHLHLENNILFPRATALEAAYG